MKRKLMALALMLSLVLALVPAQALAAQAQMPAPVLAPMGLPQEPAMPAADTYKIGTEPISGTAGQLSYGALLDFWAQFDPYSMNTMLVSGDVMLQLLKMSEFQNPMTGLNFQGTGELTTPMGAKLLRTSAMPAGKLIGLDKNYALEQIRCGDVLVEYDKLIDRQLERAAITSISGFSKLYQGAAKVLEI